MTRAIQFNITNTGTTVVYWPERKPEPTVKKITVIRKKVCALAYQLIKHGKFDSSKEAMKFAWAYIQENDCQYIEFLKVKDHSKQKRVILEDWKPYIKIKGTGRPLKEGQMMFVDVAAMIAEKHYIRSTYKQLITFKA